MTRKLGLLDLAFRVGEVTPGEKLTLLAICKLANGTGLFFASQQTVAEMTRLSLKTVGRMIRKLVARDMLIPTKSVRRATKTYIVNRERMGGQDDRSGRSNDTCSVGQDDRQNPENQKLNKRDGAEPVRRASRVRDKPPRVGRDPYNVSALGPLAIKLQQKGFSFD